MDLHLTDKIAIINNASKVREANAIQLQQLAMQTQAIMVGLQNMANSLASIFPTAKVSSSPVVPAYPVTVAPGASDAVPKTDSAAATGTAPAAAEESTE